MLHNVSLHIDLFAQGHGWRKTLSPIPPKENWKQVNQHKNGKKNLEYLMNGFILCLNWSRQL